MSLVNRTIDDRDTTDLKYAGFWFLPGTWNASNVGQSGTLASSSDVNCNVTFTFPAPAVAFYYFGIPRCCGGFYQICVDCDPNNPQWKDIDAVNVTDDGRNPPIVLYSQRFGGPPGVHVVILQNRNDTRFGKSQITLDSFVIEVPGAATTASSSAPTATATANISPSSPPPSSPSSTPLPSSAPSPSPTPIGAIVGGTVAGVLVIISAILIFIFLKRRRRGTTEASELPQHRPPGSNMSQNSTNRSASIPVNSHHRQIPTGNKGNSATSYYASTMSPSIPPSSLTTSTASNTNRATPTATSSSTGPASTNRANHSRDPSSSNSESTSRAARRSRHGRREVDAGPVGADVDEEEEGTLPPDYSDVFDVARSPTVASSRKR